jgi:hypothetical protein
MLGSEFYDFPLVCGETATALGFADAVPLAGGLFFQSSWNDALDVYGPTGTFIASGRDFRVQDVSMARTLNDAGVGCSGEVWTGFRRGFSFAREFPPFAICESANGIASVGNCDAKEAWTGFGSLRCTATRRQILCLSSGVRLPVSLTPTAAPTPKRYIIFMTSSAYPANAIRNSNCGVSGAWALVARAPELDHWDDSYSVYGPDGGYVTTARNFRTQEVEFNQTLLGAGVRCGEIWSGFRGNGGFDASPLGTCGSWQSTSSGSDTTIGTCGDYLGWGFTGISRCNDAFPHLCVLETSSATLPPTPAPPAPTPSPNDKPYYIFATSTAYVPSQMRDTNCFNDAFTLGFKFPQSARALVAGVPLINSWDDSRPVLGPSGLFITTARNFRIQSVPFARSLLDAGVGCRTVTGISYIASGFEPRALTGYPETSCSFFAGLSYYTDKHRVMNCRSLTTILSPPVLAPCNAPYQHLCLYDGAVDLPPADDGPAPTAYPTGLGTTAYPTVTPTPRPTAARYTIFATTDSYHSYEVSDENCQAEAFQLGFPNPGSAWAFIHRASRLATIDLTKAVISKTGGSLGTASDVFGNYNPTQSLQAAGVGCSSSAWTGFGTVDLSPYDCGGWGLAPDKASKVSGVASSCTTTSLVPSAPNTPCSSSLQQICVYEGETLAPTPAPTAPTSNCPATPLAVAAYSFFECSDLAVNILNPFVDSPLNISGSVCRNLSVTFPSGRAALDIGAAQIPAPLSDLPWNVSASCQSLELWVSIDASIADSDGIGLVFSDGSGVEVYFAGSTVYAGSLSIPIAPAPGTPTLIFVERASGQISLLCLGRGTTLTCDEVQRDPLDPVPALLGHTVSWMNILGFALYDECIDRTVVQEVILERSPLVGVRDVYNFIDDNSILYQ